MRRLAAVSVAVERWVDDDARAGLGVYHNAYRVQLVDCLKTHSDTAPAVVQVDGVRKMIVEAGPACVVVFAGGRIEWEGATGTDESSLALFAFMSPGSGAEWRVVFNN